MSNNATTANVRRVLAGHIDDASLNQVVDLLQRAGVVSAPIDKLHAASIDAADSLEATARKLV